MLDTLTQINLDDLAAAFGWGKSLPFMWALSGKLGRMALKYTPSVDKLICIAHQLDFLVRV